MPFDPRVIFKATCALAVAAHCVRFDCGTR